MYRKHTGDLPPLPVSMPNGRALHPLSPLADEDEEDDDVVVIAPHQIWQRKHSLSNGKAINVPEHFEDEVDQFRKRFQEDG